MDLRVSVHRGQKWCGPLNIRICWDPSRKEGSKPWENLGLDSGASPWGSESEFFVYAVGECTQAMTCVPVRGKPQMSPYLRQGFLLVTTVLATLLTFWGLVSLLLSSRHRRA